MAQKNQRASRALRKQVVVAAAVVALPGVALAQGVMTEQSGFRLGSGRLNPVLQLETAYDSAAGVVKDETKPVGDMLFHVRPGIRFLAPSETLQLKLDANYNYQAYMGTENETLSDLSQSAADVDFGALFNREGDVQFELTDRFVRSDRHDVYSANVNSIRNRNDATLRLQARSGKTWSIAPSYTLTSETFEAVIGGDAIESQLERYDNLSHNGGIEARYALAPKTALLLDLGVGYRSYTGDESKLGEGIELADDVGNFRAQAGVTSMVAPKVGVTLKAGYGSQFGLDDAATGDARGFNSAIGSAEIGWFATELTTVRLGFARSFAADPNFDYFSDDRLYVDAALAFTRQFGLRAGVAYDMITFGQPEGESDDTLREDAIVSLNLGPEYQFNRWFSAGVRYGLMSRAATVGGEKVENNPYATYDRNELAARVTFVY